MLLGVVLVACVACSGIGALGDKVDTWVIDGQLNVISCWDSDRLIQVRLVSRDGSEWTATERSGLGMPLADPVTMDDVVASGDYDLAGVLPVALVAGDHVYFQTAEEQRNYVLTDAMLSDQKPSTC